MPAAPAAPCAPANPGGPVTPSGPVSPCGPTVCHSSEVIPPQSTLMPLILPLELMQILRSSARPTLGSAASNSIAAAVVPTIQRHASFEEAGMLTPSIFFCPLAVPRSDSELIHPLPQPWITALSRGSVRNHEDPTRLQSFPSPPSCSS